MLSLDIKGKRYYRISFKEHGYAAGVISAILAASRKKRTVKNTGANKSGLDRAEVSVQYILVRVYPGGLRLSGSSRLS